tara:strand:+ start:29927 stop:31846 length:1920 start_codon:yes stop_codon:yes gene_type:complete
MLYTIWDVEADGLLNVATKIHCLSYQTYKDGILIKSGSLTTPESIVRFLVLQEGYLVAHNSIRYDIPLIEKILGYVITCDIIDTLGLSWYLYCYRKRHGLAYWGEEFGIPKPVIDDWKNLTVEEYIFRCEEDVKINAELFHKQLDYLHSIYSGNISEMKRIIGYINYKLRCLKDQEEIGVFLDQELCDRTKLDLDFIYEEKIDALRASMPLHIATVLKEKPKKPHKQDGTLSSHGQKWFDLLILKGLPEDTEVIYNLPNPGSTLQLKKWLFELGWTPATHKVSKNTGEPVPQISLPFGQGICPSVQAFYKTVEGLDNLEGLYVAKHRIGLLKSFKENVDKEGFMQANAHGFTNTMRLQHAKPIVNLPGTHKPYGKEIRGCLTVPNDQYIMCGSDISGLEDNTKQHYIYFFDPDYVTEMRVPGFDPHLDIGLIAEMLTQDDVDFYQSIKEEREDENFVWESSASKARYYTINEVRSDAKQVNFSATYGAGAAKIAKTLQKPLSQGKKLHTTYWERNKGVKQTADACLVKTFEGQKWLYNPLSGFWMFLKEDKDKFSTLNQSSGVYFFDTWLRHVRGGLSERGIKVAMQYHDELMFVCKKTDKSFATKVVRDSIVAANAECNLNVELGCSIDWGSNYADCH